MDHILDYISDDWAKTIGIVAFLVVGYYLVFAFREGVLSAGYFLTMGFLAWQFQTFLAKKDSMRALPIGDDWRVTGDQMVWMVAVVWVLLVREVTLVVWYRSLGLRPGEQNRTKNSRHAWSYVGASDFSGAAHKESYEEYDDAFWEAFRRADEETVDGPMVDVVRARALALLGFSLTAQPDAQRIRAAFSIRLREVHPDYGAPSAGAGERIARLKAARGVLLEQSCH